MAAGPFERNGMTPRLIAMGKVIRLEATRKTVAYLEAEGILDGTTWEALGVPDRETWVRAVTEVYAGAEREASKEAREELAACEELALLVRCRRCGSGEEKPCRDLRCKVVSYIRHPHQERMDDMEEQL